MLGSVSYAISEYGPDFAAGLRKTLEISALSFVLAAVLGLPLAAFLGSRLALVREAGRFVVLSLRGLPELVAMYLLYYGLGAKGVNLAPLLAACLALGVIQAAFVAEIYGAGLKTVHRGQREAAASIGLRGWQEWRLVVAPQALRFCVPGLLNTFLALLKLSVIASAIGTTDILYVAHSVMGRTYEVATVALVTVAIFVVVTLPFTWFARRVERRLRLGQARV
jgi:His/Glu/Gln/Arg/opine family amino acid ABC transporter permease subunit